MWPFEGPYWRRNRLRKWFLEQTSDQLVSGLGHELCIQRLPGHSPGLLPDLLQLPEMNTNQKPTKTKTYRIKTSEVAGKLNIDNRFVKKGEIILRLKSGEEVIADFAGKLGKREIAQGVLGSESLIVTLDDLKKIVIDIKVPENYVSILKPGLKAEITSSAFKKTFKGKIQTISSRIDPSTRSILSRVLVDNSDFKIIPGQLMTVKIIYDEINQVGVPESTVTIQGSTAFVYTVRDETAEKKNIEIGKRNFGKVSVISGIDEGELVITEGVSKVRNNAKIKIIDPNN